jgi:site-specific DNA-methyltransferase (adenine-specific)
MSIATLRRPKNSNQPAAEFQIASIRLGNRTRKDVGDLESLAESIAEIGILQPVVVTPDGRLIAGFRRIQACKKLGWKTIPVRVVDLDRVVEGEFAENVFRKDFTLSEIAAIAKRLRPIVEKRAHQRRIIPLKQGKSVPVVQNLDLGEKGKSRNILARYVGVSSTTLEKIEAVVAAAEENPKKFGHLKDGMDATGKVNRHYQQLRMTREFDYNALNGQAFNHKTASTKDIQIHCGDCLKVLPTQIADRSVSVVVTSPPYNRGVQYNSYKDDLPFDTYLKWLEKVFKEIKRILRNEGSFFLNVGGSRKEPWHAMRIAEVAAEHFVLQNEIIWVKAITVEGKSHGHFTPVPGDRYLNHNFEPIYHFTKKGTVSLDRLAVGVPYQDQSNLLRNTAAKNLRCCGDVWFVPYETVQSKFDNGSHPSPFPVELVRRCIQLAGIRKNTVVCDPFMGSGTSMCAAQELGVRGIGIEIDPAYCRHATKRLR